MDHRPSNQKRVIDLEDDFMKNFFCTESDDYKKSS